jgi:hypothetical protein
MSDPKHAATAEQPAVSTAPARSRWHWSAIPTHLGRARTSTCVLSALFLLIGALYLNVKPEPVATATTTETGNQQPAQTSTPAPPTAPETTTEAPATTTDEAPTTTDEAPTTTTTTDSTTTEAPTDESPPAQTTETGVPTTPTLPMTRPTTPAGTTSSPPAG